MATIRRTRQTQQFLTLANAVARDSRLSHRARGVLIWILSLPPDATVSSDDLAGTDRLHDNREGRDAIRTAMRELAELGYARLHKVRDDRGRITSEWHVSDEAAPGPEKPSPADAPKSPGPEIPTPAQPTPEDQALIQKPLPKNSSAAANLTEQQTQTVELLTAAGLSVTEARRLAATSRRPTPPSPRPPQAGHSCHRR